MPALSACEQAAFQIETLIVRLKRERPNWGAEIREKLRRSRGLRDTYLIEDAITISIL